MKMAAIPLLLLAACTTDQLYEGTELPPESVVRIEAWSSFWDGTRTDLFVVDGKEAGSFWGHHAAEVLPGEHEIVARASQITTAYTPAILGDMCRLRFTGEAGGVYEVRTERSELHPPFCLKIVDARTDTVVADNEPDSLEDCLSAEPELDGREWVIVKGSTEWTRSVAVLVPVGETLEETPEWLELQCYGADAGPPDVDVVMDQLWEAWKDVADDPESTVLARDSSATPGLTFIFRGDVDDRTHCALTVLRTDGPRVHVLMWNREAPDFTPAELATWRERFAKARLFEPRVR